MATLATAQAAQTHRRHIYATLGVTDRAAAVAEGFNCGLLTPEKPARP
jgi:DNA-binding CsgD family transcriptional regulator